ncbi:DNA-(apurinic or apyrimidinic site) lyase [Monosporozyma unispora]|nr:DNA-(apurinic or apyrimidinic site) lyase [Kazachstania unispora]
MSFVKSVTTKYKFGAHVSTAGGISKSVLNANKLGCQSFAMFLKSPRKWESPPLTDEEIDKFKLNCEKCKYDPLVDILPHGHYFINLCNPDEEKAQKAYSQLIDELHRCEQLGIGHYNLHPGSALKGGSVKLQLKQLAKYLNKAIGETKFVIIVLENMAGKDNIIGNQLEDLRDVIDIIDNKERIGVCVDTCHTFASGYDIQSSLESFNKFWTQFDEIIGFNYLKSMHINDSKAPRESCQDLHEKLGQGFIGLEPFRWLAHDQRFEKIPLILETPHKDDNGYGEEIELLQWLETIDDPENEELKFKVEELQKLGAKTRHEQQAKYDKKQAQQGKKRKVVGGDILSQLSKTTKKKKVKPE